MDGTSLAAAIWMAGVVTMNNGDNYDIERYLEPNTKVLIINHDVGGDIDRYERNFQILRDRGIKVRISGPCISACMFYMTLPGVCATPGGQFWAHTPWLSSYSLPWRRDIEAISRRYWTPSVLNYVNKRGGIWKIGRENYLKMNALRHIKAC